MDWHFAFPDRQMLIASLIRDQSGRRSVDGRSWQRHRQTLAKKYVAHDRTSGHLWAVVAIANVADDGRILQAKTAILLTQIRRDPAESPQFWWGYRDIAEREGLTYYDCPLRYLALATAADRVWRAAVYRRYALERGITVKEVTAKVAAYRRAAFRECLQAAVEGA